MDEWSVEAIFKKELGGGGVAQCRDTDCDFTTRTT